MVSDTDFLDDRSLSDELMMKAIAARLRDNPSKFFLLELAMMFDPGHPKQKPRFRFSIKRPSGRPAAKRIEDAGELVADLVQRDGMKPEAAVQEAMTTFSLGRSSVYSAYRRELRLRASAKRFAELGVDGFSEIVQEWW